MREGIILTRNEAADLFLILSNAKVKCNGKFKTKAEIYWQKFEDILLPKHLNT